MAHFSLAIATEEKPNEHTILELLDRFTFDSIDHQVKLPYMDREEAYQFALEHQDRLFKGINPLDLTDKEIIEAVADYNGVEIDENENLVYYTNPDALMDWMAIGGRWANILISKKDQLGYNTLPLSEIDWSATLPKQGTGKLSDIFASFVSDYGLVWQDLDADDYTIEDLKGYAEAGYYLTVVDCHV